MRKAEDLFRTITAVVVDENPMLDDVVERFERIAPAVKDFLAEWKEGLSDVEIAGWLLLYQAQWFLKRGEWEPRNGLPTPKSNTIRDVIPAIPRLLPTSGRDGAATPRFDGRRRHCVLREDTKAAA
jgi:hypothetical protein